MNVVGPDPRQVFCDFESNAQVLPDAVLHFVVDVPTDPEQSEYVILVGQLQSDIGVRGNAPAVFAKVRLDSNGDIEGITEDAVSNLERECEKRRRHRDQRVR